LKVIQHFGKHCSCYLQSEYLKAGSFWQPYKGQAMGSKLDVMELTGEVKQQAAIQQEMSTWVRKSGNKNILRGIWR
jgi:hypothetical protein